MRRASGWARILLGVAVAGTAGFFGWRAMEERRLFGKLAADLPAAVDEAKRLGIPLTAAEILPWKSPVPEADNAYPPLLAIKFPGVSVDDVGGPRVADDIRDALALGQFEEAGKLLARVDPQLAAVEALSRRPRFDMNRVWDAGSDAFSLPVPDEIRLVSLLGLRARYRASTGNLDGALRDVEAIFRMANLVEQDPSVIYGLVSLLFRSVGHDTLRRIAYEGRGDERVLTRAIEIAEGDRLGDFLTTLRGETYLGTSIFRSLETWGGWRGMASQETDEFDLGAEVGKPQVDARRLRREGLPDGLPARALLAYHLRSWSRVWRIGQDHSADPRALLDTLNEARANAAPSPVPGGEPWDENRLDLLIGYAETRLDALAQRAVSRAYVEVLIIQQRSGRLPERLPAAEWNLDSCTDKPLRFRLEGRGFRIWSPGSDGRDDGGRMRGEPGAERDGDGMLKVDIAATSPPFTPKPRPEQEARPPIFMPESGGQP